MKTVIKSVLVGLLALTIEPAVASTSTGVIGSFRMSAGASPARVSILLNSPTVCPIDGWYAFEDAHSGLGEVWKTGVLAAYNTGRQVTIVGTDTCDQFGVEQIHYIDLL